MPAPTTAADSLLEFAVAVLTSAPERTGMGELARRLGLSKSSIYHHVSGKEELLEPRRDTRLRLPLRRTREDPGPDATATARFGTSCGAVRGARARTPYVTLLLRVHGNSDSDGGLWSGAWVRPPGRRLVARTATEGGYATTSGPPREPALFGTVNSAVECTGRSAVCRSHAGRHPDGLLFDGLCGGRPAN